jgi:UPF0176 protein
METKGSGYIFAASCLHQEKFMEKDKQKLLALEAKPYAEPKDSRIATAPLKPYQTLLFYKYVHLPEAEIYAAQLLKFCKDTGLTGRVLVAEEGINGTVSGTVEQCNRFIHHLHNDERFSDMEFKIDEENNTTFAKMHVRYKKEIVHFGQPDVNVWERTGTYLEPEEWEKMMHDEDVVVLDVRNKVEWELGRFKNAVTVDIDHFRDLPQAMPQLESYKDKKVLAYCTGGIRCEKATAYLIQQGFKNVFHLHGGIIKYGKVTGGKDFDGQCYVFDNRIGIDVNYVNPTVISQCKICNTKTTKMVNCANPECNEHFVLCDDCGWTMNGCCSNSCKESPRLRVYDGTGYYQKGTQQWIND